MVEPTPLRRILAAPLDSSLPVSRVQLPFRLRIPKLRRPRGKRLFATMPHELLVSVFHCLLLLWTSSYSTSLYLRSNRPGPYCPTCPAHFVEFESSSRAGQSGYRAGRMADAFIICPPVTGRRMQKARQHPCWPAFCGSSLISHPPTLKVASLHPHPTTHIRTQFVHTRKGFSRSQLAANLLYEKGQTIGGGVCLFLRSGTRQIRIINPPTL